VPRRVRVSRGAEAWAWPAWAYAGEYHTFGNRFDDAAGEYRVLFATSQRVWAFVETFSRYLIGEDPLRIEHHWQAMYRGSPWQGVAQFTAMSGLEQALFAPALHLVLEGRRAGKMDLWPAPLHRHVHGFAAGACRLHLKQALEVR